MSSARLWLRRADRSHAFRTRASMPAGGGTPPLCILELRTDALWPLAAALGLSLRAGSRREGAGSLVSLWCMRWLDGERGGGWGGGNDAAAMGRVRWCAEGDRVWKGDVMWMRVDGEALASPLTLICVGEAPASSRRRWTSGADPAPARRLRRAAGAATATATVARATRFRGEARDRRAAACGGAQKR